MGVRFPPGVPRRAAVASMPPRWHRTVQRCRMRICGHCRELRPDEDYGVRDRRTGRRHTICIVCRRAYWNAYAQRHRVRYNAAKRRRAALVRARNRAILDERLARHPCVDCGITDPLVLEFDHVRGLKVRDVTTMAHEAAREDRLRAEIAKCEVRCANCHRRRTALCRGPRDLTGQGFHRNSAYWWHSAGHGDCSSVG